MTSIDRNAGGESAKSNECRIVGFPQLSLGELCGRGIRKAVLPNIWMAPLSFGASVFAQAASAAKKTSPRKEEEEYREELVATPRKRTTPDPATPPAPEPAKPKATLPAPEPAKPKAANPATPPVTEPKPDVEPIEAKKVNVKPKSIDDLFEELKTMVKDRIDLDKPKDLTKDEKKTLTGLTVFKVVAKIFSFALSAAAFFAITAAVLMFTALTTIHTAIPYGIGVAGAGVLFLALNKLIDSICAAKDPASKTKKWEDLQVKLDDKKAYLAELMKEKKWAEDEKLRDNFEEFCAAMQKELKE